MPPRQRDRSSRASRHAVAPPHERRATKPKAETNGCISTLFKKGFDITDVYPYRDRNGELLYENVRLERSSNGQRIKTFRQRRPDGAGGWVESIEGIPRVPYRLPELLQTDGQNIHATEGEKDTNRLASIGLASTYIAAPTSKENAPDLNVFSGRFVYIHEDNDVAGRLRYEIALDGKTTELGEEELRALRLEADALGLRPRDTYFDDVCLDLARRNSHHPVREYLDSLQWDGIPCLDRWLSVYAGAEDTELICAFGRKHLVAAVRRVRQPGCKYDTCLVLDGPQGAGKRSAGATARAWRQSRLDKAPAAYLSSSSRT